MFIQLDHEKLDVFNFSEFSVKLMEERADRKSGIFILKRCCLFMVASRVANPRNLFILSSIGCNQAAFCLTENSGWQPELQAKTLLLEI